MDLTCKKCNKNFTTRANMKYHEINAVCSLAKRFRCAKCNTGFAHRSSLSRHNKTCTSNITSNDADSMDGDIDKKELLKMFHEMQKKLSQIPDLQAQINDLKTENSKL